MGPEEPKNPRGWHKKMRGNSHKRRGHLNQTQGVQKDSDEKTEGESFCVKYVSIPGNGKSERWQGLEEGRC